MDIANGIQAGSHEPRVQVAKSPGWAFATHDRVTLDCSVSMQLCTVVVRRMAVVVRED